MTYCIDTTHLEIESANGLKRIEVLSHRTHMMICMTIYLIEWRLYDKVYVGHFQTFFSDYFETNLDYYTMNVI